MTAIRVTTPREAFQHEPLEACADCFEAVAYDTPPIDRPDLLRVIDAQWPRAKGWALIESDSHGDNPFSWDRCECCGSPLGGLRYPLIAFRESYVREAAV